MPNFSYEIKMGIPFAVYFRFSILLSEGLVVFCNLVNLAVTYNLHIMLLMPNNRHYKCDWIGIFPGSACI